jgi:hypothetical protein
MSVTLAGFGKEISSEQYCGGQVSLDLGSPLELSQIFPFLLENTYLQYQTIHRALDIHSIVYRQQSRRSLTGSSTYLLPASRRSLQSFDFAPLDVWGTQYGPGGTSHQFTDSGQDSVLMIQGRIKQISFTATPSNSDASQEGGQGAFRIILPKGPELPEDRNGVSWSYTGSCNWTNKDYDLIETGNLELFALIIAIAPPPPPESSLEVGVYGIFLVPTENSEVEGRVFRRVGMFIHLGFHPHFGLEPMDWEDQADQYLEHEFADSEFCTFSIV